MIKRRGFTLIELLLYMGLLSIFLVVLTSIFLSILDAQLRSETSSAVDVDGKFLLNRLSWDIHRASGIIVPAAAGQTSSQLTLTISGGNYAIASSSGALQLTTGGVSERLTGASTTLTGFSVTRRGNPNGKDTLTITFSLSSQTTAHTYTLTEGLR